MTFMYECEFPFVVLEGTYETFCYFLGRDDVLFVFVESAVETLVSFAEFLVF